LVPGLEIEAQDRVVTKTRYSGFYNTDLRAELRSLEVDSLVICGINTHACIRSTVVDAFMRDYRVWIPNECVASYDQAGHERSLDYLSRRMARVVNLEEVLARIRRQDLSFRFERR
jgi:isochorismate hydrolase